MMIQISFWVVIVLMTPLFDFIQHGSLLKAIALIPSSLREMIPWLLIYFANYIYLVPKHLFSDEKRGIFYIANILMFTANSLRLVPQLQMVEEVQFPEGVTVGLDTIFKLVSAFYFFIQFVLVLLAVGSNYVERYYLLKKNAARQKQKAAEAEITWLKNQLNPHFLFNTLNNISSLTQIDPDKAQESIAQLSYLLRYALYESDVEKVDLSNEVQFMENYIDLMSLRCNYMTTITKGFCCPQGDVKIAPLLFISLIENAFKHGVNARSSSFVSVRMYPEGHDLVFCCKNSVFEKSGVDRIGSGIGLSNMKKRLELIYPDRYKYETVVEDGVYSAIIILKGIC